MSLVSVYETPWGYGEETVLAVSPLVAKAVIEELTFPSSAEIDVQSNWSLVVHNIGTEGRFAVIIVNASGNPGDIKVTWEGREWILPPTNRGLRIFSSSPEPNCMRIRANGQIAFTVEGSYNIRVLAQHEGLPDVWLSDEERIITVNVAGVTPPEWPVQIPLPFSGRLAPGAFLEAEKSTPIKDVDLTKLLGGRVDYTLTYESGKLLTGITLYIYWNEELMATEAFLIGQVGKIISGSFDLGTARIKATNSLRVRMSQAPLGYNVASFNIPTILGFSEEPAQPPSGEEWWNVFFDWLDSNKYWMALGVVGVSALLIYKPGPPIPPIVIVQPPRQRGGK
ncbi:hypothetical protein LCGC14_0815860 [marine sediment metagenome]|uniref:Uncharacterized protein n=1 Tax=marine sediment metagenome TaxID=412755 RepID=A0A0F9S572_9ZZZZ